MKVMGVNGSPRKKWNTATLLENALAGAAAKGAKAEAHFDQSEIVRNIILQAAKNP